MQKIKMSSFFIVFDLIRSLNRFGECLVMVTLPLIYAFEVGLGIHQLATLILIVDSNHINDHFLFMT